MACACAPLKLHSQIKNACDVCITAVCWACVGHGLAYGKSVNGVTGGASGFLVHHGRDDTTATQYASWLFNWGFASTTATIVSGAVAERIHFRCYLAFCVVLSTLIFPIVAHWAWNGGGWLSNRLDASDRIFGCGALDLAGWVLFLG